MQYASNISDAIFSLFFPYKINEIQGEFEAKVDYYSSLEQEIKELTKYRAYYEKYT